MTKQARKHRIREPLREIMVGEHLTIPEVADLTEVPYQTVWAIRQGAATKCPRFDTVKIVMGLDAGDVEQRQRTPAHRLNKITWNEGRHH